MNLRLRSDFSFSLRLRRDLNLWRCRHLNLRRYRRGGRRGGRIVRQRRRLVGVRGQHRFDRKNVVRISLF